MSAVAKELAGWFDSICDLCDRSIFGVATGPDHQRVMARAILGRYTRTILESPLDTSGRLHWPTCAVVASASSLLGVRLEARHWAGAIRALSSAGDIGGTAARRLGIGIQSPAELFKILTEEMLIHAGLTDHATVRSEDDWRASLGLAINWGIRFLLACALITEGSRSCRVRGAMRDVHWLRDRVVAAIRRGGKG